MAEKLEHAFDAIRDEWWNIAHRLSVKDISAELGHAASCNSSVSDFGTMLAWTYLFKGWDKADENVLMVCDDPWLFRHFRSLGGRTLIAAPGRWFAEQQFTLRGIAARTRYALQALSARIYLARDAENCPRDSPAIVSYGHPASTADGKDAYFGDLLSWSPKLSRLLHTDCNVERAAALGLGGRTFSLQAWGSIWFTFTLPFQMWHMTLQIEGEPMWWLMHRAAVLENGTGQAAAIAWQNHCQERWLKIQRPSIVLWPWENHGWEQALVRSAKPLGVGTAGYQHTVVGRRHWVHAVASNRDGIEGLPDRIICNGPVWENALSEYGIPRDRMEVGGALRFSSPKLLTRDKAGPIFVALPFTHSIAHQLVAAIEIVAGKNQFRFIVRDHPMNPYPLPVSPGIERADRSLAEAGGIAAVLYAATTVGLEAIIGGLPVVRFVPEGNVSVDVIPESLGVPVAVARNLSDRLSEVIGVEIDVPSAGEFFRQPNKPYWEDLISTRRSNF